MAVESRKIQIERLDADASRLRDAERRADGRPPSNVIRPGDGGRLPEVQQVSPQLRRSRGKASAELEELDSEIVDARSSNHIRRSSPGAEIADFIMPKLSDPAILHTSRALGILEHLMADIIPTFTESKELRAIAVAVITTEIARRRDLLDHVHRGIAS
jgi:hypothetical protein